MASIKRCAWSSHLRRSSRLCLDGIAPSPVYALHAIILPDTAVLTILQSFTSLHHGTHSGYALNATTCLHSAWPFDAHYRHHWYAVTWWHFGFAVPSASATTTRLSTVTATSLFVACPDRVGSVFALLAGTTVLGAFNLTVSTAASLSWLIPAVCPLGHPPRPRSCSSYVLQQGVCCGWLRWRHEGRTHTTLLGDHVQHSLLSLTLGLWHR